MGYTLRQSRDLETNQKLFARGLPGDEWVGDHHTFWIAYAPSGEVCGFCSAVQVDAEHSVFLSSAVVFPAHRGKGLQRRMIRHRIAWAKRNGATTVVTYTVPHNWRSINSILRLSFQYYEPAWAWAGRGAWYFFRPL